MKQKKTIYIIILLLTTLTGMWAIPSLVKKITYTPDDYPFVYYSSILKELCLVDYKNKENPLTDLSGNVYSTAQFDSLMPMLNYRQLMVNGQLPDSIDGHEITPQILRAKTVVFKYDPRKIETPHTKLYILFEAMPKRVGLEVPDDVMRLDNDIQFIDAQTNKVNDEKSTLFREALLKEGFTFPSQWASGNPNPRKPYDEGYFSLDAEGNLFHIKMVNGRPYVKNTLAGDSINIASFFLQEVSDKRFYGYILSSEGDVFVLEEDGGKYKPLRLDIDRLDIKNNELLIMGNLLYWTVSITTPQGRNYYVLHSETLKRVTEHGISRPENKWEKVAEWSFPVYLTVEEWNSDYLMPRFHFTAVTAFAVNVVLALLVGIFVSNTKKRRLFNALFVLVTGIAGLVALLILPEFRRKNF